MGTELLKYKCRDMFAPLMVRSGSNGENGCPQCLVDVLRLVMSIVVSVQVWAQKKNLNR